MFSLPSLPYSEKDLEPYISEKTISYHYGKHHQTYVDNLNRLIADSPLKDLSLEEIIAKSDGVLFNNAAQVWNHTFYWESLSENHKQQPSNLMDKTLSEHFGSSKEFIETFSQQAATLFGSGWTWLVLDQDGKLKIIQTKDAETPITMGMIPLLTCDVWEHAYYLDTQNARPKYIENFWQVVNWHNVEQRYLQALQDLT